MNNSQPADNSAVQLWDPRVHLREVDPQAAHYSRGFLKARPELWFPGFAAAWLPLTHSLGAEVRVLEVKPQLSWPKQGSYTFTAAVDDEPLLIRLERESARVLLEALLPGTGFRAAEVFLEYLARRLVSTIGTTWTGPPSSSIRFESEPDDSNVRSIAAIKLKLQISGQVCVVWFILGQFLVDKLDALWQRQERAAQRSAVDGGMVSIELGQLAVPPNMLVDYTRSGAMIDLEVPISDVIAVRLPDGAKLSARLVTLGGTFGIEALAGHVPNAPLPAGTTRLVVEFGAIALDAGQIADLSNAGALIDTAIALSPLVRLTINGQVVKEASLCTYENRFAVNVG